MKIIGLLLIAATAFSQQPNPDRISFSVTPYALFGDVSLTSNTAKANTKESYKYDGDFGLKIALQFPIQRQMTVGAFINWESLTYSTQAAFATSSVTYSQSLIRAGGTFTLYFDN
jgi:outer membrane protein assembly factor BamA